MSIHVSRSAIAHGCPCHQIQGGVFQHFFMVLVSGRLQMAILTEGCKPDPSKHIPEVYHGITSRASKLVLHSGAHGRMGRGSREGQTVGRVSLGLRNQTGGNRSQNTCTDF